MDDVSNESGSEDKKKRKKPDLPIISIKNTADYQRMKLERLFANPEKCVIIPTKPRDKNLPPPPEFVRNVMGSSAGAGSGEFHVYRHLRRKEYARQRSIREKSRVEQLDEDFQLKVDYNKNVAEQKTAKKREKRQRQKKTKKARTQDGPTPKEGNDDDSSSNNSDSEDDKNKNVDTKSLNNENNGSAGQKNGSHNSSNKPKHVVPTYSSYVGLHRPNSQLPHSDTSSDSD